MRKFMMGLVWLCSATSAMAMPLQMPADDVILTVTGRITNTNSAQAAVFDKAMLDGLPGRETTTETPWFDGKHTFKGPLLSAVLGAVSAEGTVVHVTAVNDYSADIPITDIQAHPVIIATEMDGKAMSIREKGPLFVIYPFDIAPELYNEEIFGRSVWQVISIDVQ